MNQPARALIALLLVLGWVMPGIAQHPPGVLESGARQALADSVAALVEGTYAVPDTGRLIADHVRAQARAGAYDGASTLSGLAQMLTRDLRAINGDLHLNVSHDPDRAAGLVGAAETVTEAQRAEAERRMADRERRANYFVEEVKVLPGNVGLLRINAFSMLPEAFEVVEQALRFIERTDAVILDLRGHEGGSARMANFLISHFTGPNLHSLDTYWRGRDEWIPRHTLDEVPGPRRTGVPLYVLVSARTGSAGEDVPFVLQNLERARIVGETTAGMGRNNRHFSVGEGLIASVSVSRVLEPATGREWGRVGVIPDIPVPSGDALAAAHLHALERIGAATADEAHRQELAMVREFVEAGHRSVDFPAARLADFEGRYGAGLEVFVEQGGLWIRVGDHGPVAPLTPLSDARFALGPTRRVSFVEGPDGSIHLELIIDGRSDGLLPRID